MKQAILDTDTLSFFFRNKPEVVEKVNEYLDVHGILNLSVVTYYEVLNGLFYKDAHSQLRKFERFIDLNQVIFLNVEIAKKAAKIYANLRKTGQVIGHNDVLIAATAIVYDLTLITNNVGHLSRIPELSLENWVLQ